jgi:hypothetical protein
MSDIQTFRIEDWSAIISKAEARVRQCYDSESREMGTFPLFTATDAGVMSYDDFLRLTTEVKALLDRDTFNSMYRVASISACYPMVQIFFYDKRDPYPSGDCLVMRLSTSRGTSEFTTLELQIASREKEWRDSLNAAREARKKRMIS